jgi:hypothetical protein
MYTKRIDKVSRDITMLSEKLKANLIFKMKKELHERVYSDTIFSNRDNSFIAIQIENKIYSQLYDELKG